MIRVTVTGLGLPDPAGVIPGEVRAGTQELVAFLEREVKRRTPIGVTEAARGSIAGEVRAGDGLGVGSVIGLVGSPLKHVAVINDGRRAGQPMPPPESLELWVRRKLKKTGPRGGLHPLTVKEARSLAFVIARAIGLRGIEGKKFFEAAVEENESTIRRILEGVGTRIVIELSRGN